MEEKNSIYPIYGIKYNFFNKTQIAFCAESDEIFAKNIIKEALEREYNFRFYWGEFNPEVYKTEFKTCKRGLIFALNPLTESYLL